MVAPTDKSLHVVVTRHFMPWHHEVTPAAGRALQMQRRVAFSRDNFNIAAFQARGILPIFPRNQDTISEFMKYKSF